MAEGTHGRGWDVRWQLERPTSACKRKCDVPQRYSHQAEGRRIFGYMGGRLERVRHVLPVSDWLAESGKLRDAHSRHTWSSTSGHILEEVAADH